MARLDGLDWLVIAASVLACYLLTAMIIKRVTLPTPTEQG